MFIISCALKMSQFPLNNAKKRMIGLSALFLNFPALFKLRWREKKVLRRKKGFNKSSSCKKHSISQIPRIFFVTSSKSLKFHSNDSVSLGFLWWPTFLNEKERHFLKLGLLQKLSAIFTYI